MLAVLYYETKSTGSERSGEVQRFSESPVWSRPGTSNSKHNEKRSDVVRLAVFVVLYDETKSRHSGWQREREIERDGSWKRTSWQAASI